jgi:hypothetical protein
LHVFDFNISNSEEKAAYLALVESLKAKGLKCFESHGAGSHYIPQLAGPVTLETDFLFDNQWNTEGRDGKNGHRVFDWAMDYKPNNNPNLKRGHWLEQTEEMRTARANRCKCGFCGNQMDMPDVPKFCPKCLDSEYLKSTELHLTRMQPIANEVREPLTPDELAERLPLYKDAQLHGTTARGRARIAKRRADLLKERDSAIRNANTEYDGMIWLMDHGITEQPIYYNHTGRFCFGWRSGGVDAAVKPDLIAALDGFPFPFDIK